MTSIDESLRSSALLAACEVIQGFIDSFSESEWRSFLQANGLTRTSLGRTRDPTLFPEFALIRVAPLMSIIDRARIVEAIWKKTMPTSRTEVYFGRSANFAVFWNKFKEIVEQMPGNHWIPDSLLLAVPWLKSREAVVEQRRLNCLRVHYAREILAAMTRTIWLGLDQMSVRDGSVRKIVHEFKIGEHQFVLTFNNETRGISFYFPLPRIPPLKEKLAMAVKELLAAPTDLLNEVR